MRDKQKDTRETSLKQMEASRIPAAKVGTPATNTVRVCWAAKTLVFEFTTLFPETPIEYSNPDGRNTMLDVSFDLTVFDTDEQVGAVALLELVETDARVSAVIVEDSAVVVAFKSSPRTQDDRALFGLADAWDVLCDGSAFDEPSEWESEHLRQIEEGSA